MAPKYTLSYFPIKALAEPIRLLLSYGNIEFDDKRITSEEWPKLKSSMPLGQMPVLEIDGKVLYQSTAIARYLGKLVGLNGSGDLEALDIDIAVDTINEFRQKVASAHYESDAERKEKLFVTLTSETIPFYLKKLDAMANKGYFAAGKLTWADFVFVGLVDYISFISRQDITENYPNLKAVKDNVLSIPAVKEWYAKSPKCEY